MKIIIAYPPISTAKGCPLLAQNRQFQFFKEPTYIYPVVPAQAATLLKNSGYEVIWLDCIAENISYDKFLKIIENEKPGLIAIETKTPVVKEHWKIINDIKNKTGNKPQGQSPQCWDSQIGNKPQGQSPQCGDSQIGNKPQGQSPQCGDSPYVVLFGDHVTALPEESFQNSKVDFVLAGGDYDFLLLNLCNYISAAKEEINLRDSPHKTGTVKDEINLGDSPHKTGTVKDEINLGDSPHKTGTVPMLEPGIYYRENGQVKNTGKFQLDHDLNSLPFIDRDLTKWQSYAYKNGNYKRTPGTYIMSGRDCWWGKCSFCSWTTLYPKFRMRSVDNVLDEIGILIEKYNVREIMDDSGCFPAGGWLNRFCDGMIKRGYHKKVYIDCNMRFGALSADELVLMKKANFRLLLFGLESASQSTLDRVNKSLRVERIIQDCKSAVKAGLYPHITIMFGYPWESYADARNTLKLGSWLLKKGYAYTMQATMVIPYPGTPLFEECKNKGLLRTLDWADYDMKNPVMKSGIPDEKILELVQSMYKIPFQPEFILRKLFSLRDADDLKYYFRAVKKVFGHIFDFTGSRPADGDEK